MFRHIGFYDENAFRRYLLDSFPAHSYHSSSYYQHPEADMAGKAWSGADLVFDIDADHYNLPCQHSHDKWKCRNCGLEGTGKPPEVCTCGKASFDEESWLCEQCLQAAKHEAQKLLDILIQDFGFSTTKDLVVNFSGNRGYHVHVRSQKIRNLDQSSSSGRASWPRDVERRVVYPVIAKPVSRSAYLLGRYLGLGVALVLNLAVMAAFLAAMLAIDARGLEPVNVTFGSAVLAMGVQLLVVGAVAVLFSAVTTPTLASIFALAVTIAGHLTNDMRAFWRGAEWVATGIWYLVPNLSAFSLNEAVIYASPVPAGTWIAALYGLLYAAAALALAAFAFERRDLR